MSFNLIPNSAGGAGAAAFIPTSDATFYEDWLSALIAGDHGWVSSQTGTGAFYSLHTSASIDTAINDGRPGVIILTTGTTATGRINVYNSTKTYNWGSGESSVIHIQDIKLPVLSTITEEYIASYGMSTQQTTLATRTNGAYFYYDRLGVGTTWQCETNDGGVTTTVDSGVTVDTIWNSFKITVAADLSAVTFFINDVSVASITTNIPTGVNFLHNLGIFKSAGTTAALLYHDFIFTRFTYAAGLRPS